MWLVACGTAYLTAFAAWFVCTACHPASTHDPSPLDMVWTILTVALIASGAIVSSLAIAIAASFDEELPPNPAQSKAGV
jgi:hypothetical protein